MENKIPTSIDKRFLWRYVNAKIKHLIHSYHVSSILSILFEEILRDLKEGKKIKIDNLGILSLNKTNPRLYYNVVTRNVSLSKKSKNKLKFILDSNLKKLLFKNLDIDNTFKDN